MRNTGDGGSGFEALEPRQMLATDLAVSLGALENRFDRGAKTDKIKVVATITNVGDGRYTGGGNVVFFLSTDNVLDGNDVRFATQKLPGVTSPGSRGKVKLDVAEPKFVNPSNSASVLAAGAYFVIAKLELSPGGVDTNAANDTSASVQTVSVDYTFGRVDSANTYQSLTVQLPNGASVEFSLKGAGLGTLSRDSSGRTVVTITGTDRKSDVSIKVKDKKRTGTIGVVSVTSPLKSLKGESVFLQGSASFTRGVGELKLSGVRSSSVTVADPFLFYSETVLDLGEVTNSVVVQEDGTVNRLQVKSWRDTDGSPDSFRAASAKQISASGDFQASVTLEGPNGEGLAVSRVQIKGEVSGEWRMARGVETIQVGSVASSFRAGIVGPIENLRTSGEFSGLWAFQTLKRLEIGGSVNGATMLAGTILGEDLLLGGTGANGDQFFPGTIEFITIKGVLNNSTIAAGLRTTDDVLLNGDDTFVTAGFSGVRALEVRLTMQNTTFVSSVLPDRVKINRRNVNTSGDVRFVRVLPVGA
jgi:hypothetical protein